MPILNICSVILTSPQIRAYNNISFSHISCVCHTGVAITLGRHCHSFQRCNLELQCEKEELSNGSILRDKGFPRQAADKPVLRFSRWSAEPAKPRPGQGGEGRRPALLFRQQSRRAQVIRTGARERMEACTLPWTKFQTREGVA